MNTNFSEKYEDIYDVKNTVEEALNRLIYVLSLLRSECEWDRVQTHDSLKICMIEEAYEACDAIEKGDMKSLEEELGDVLLQVLFHSAIAEEASNFNLVSVINKECDKMIRRHPHVFSKESVKSIDKAVEKWENVKWKEQGDMSYGQRLESIPKAMPALIRSYKIQAKAAEAGFDWDDVSGAFQKIKEETEELAQVCICGDTEKIFEELGDLLFSVVNLSRFLKVNPEQALNGTSAKFIKRFIGMEAEASERGKALMDMTLEEMDEIWDIVKKR
jgi:tetrapyrrole methylase family protein/MazG family protein